MLLRLCCGYTLACRPDETREETLLVHRFGRAYREV